MKINKNKNGYYLMCGRAVKFLDRLCRTTVSSEPSLVAIREVPNMYNKVKFISEVNSVCLMYGYIDAKIK